jgi:hypothetical protein
MANVGPNNSDVEKGLSFKSFKCFKKQIACKTANNYQGIHHILQLQGVWLEVSVEAHAEGPVTGRSNNISSGS